MKNEGQELSLIGHFALACERMNEFARSLRGSSLFGTVSAGADIRYYESGWRLEKWVEAELDRAEGMWAAWWLELGPTKDGWIVESHLSTGPDGLFIGLEDRLAASPKELEEHLSAVVEDLKHALQQNSEFAEEIKRRKRIRPD